VRLRQNCFGKLLPALGIRPVMEGRNFRPAARGAEVSRLYAGDLGSVARVLCGDATSAAALARLLGERKCDLWFTERPYGIDLDSADKPSVRARQ